MAALRKTVVVAIGALVATVGLAVPASADTDDNPCEGGVAGLLCRFMPIAPGLDHDVDLTQDPNGLNAAVNGEAVNPEAAPQASHGDPPSP